MNVHNKSDRPLDQRYCIKDGYTINSIAQTLDNDQTGSYWTEERLQISRYYQYDVYKLAARLCRRNNVHSLLDVGCGSGVKVSELLAGCVEKITLIDQPSCGVIVKRLVPGARFIAADLETMNVEINDKFDLIICSDVVEHLYDPLPCLDFIRRHLNRCGVAIISTPEREVLRGKDCAICSHPSHVREWSKKEFANFLAKIGYTVGDHLLLPPQRLSIGSAMQRRVAGWVASRARWHGCQVAVCPTKTGGSDENTIR